MIYLDNAATTHYKPETVIRAVENALRYYSANPGRSGHKLSSSAAEKVYAVRQKVADFFGADGAENVVFTANCTQSINFVLKGVLSKGDHVIISDLEHNAVARPAFKLQKDGVINLDTFNGLNEDIEAQLLSLITPKTKLIFCTHASNVCGKILDIEKIGSFCKQHGILFGVDAAQTAGVLPIDMNRMGIDFLCIAPHKGLFAPMGTGILIARKSLPKTVIEGGTGTASLSLVQPEEMPERLESGTVNLPGIFGIGAGIDFINLKGRENIYRHEAALCTKLCNDLKKHEKISVYMSGDFLLRYAPVVSVNLQGMGSDEVAGLLSEKGVAVRGGFHCAPLAHNTLGTASVGTVRISPGITNNVSDIEYLKKILFGLANKKYINNI